MRTSTERKVLGTVTDWCLGIATYIMLWPEDGRMMKEDIRGIYDGSIFYTIAARRAKKTK
jgi:peroxygenase